MRAFDHPNMLNFECPICKTNDDKPVVLIGIIGTENNNIIKARQYHLSCIELQEQDCDEGKIIFQRVEDK